MYTGINRKSTSTSQAMIENPIYNGPVYETVPQRYNPLCSSASTTPDSSPTTPLNDNIHCTANPTYRTGIIDLVRKNTLPTQPNDRILSPLAGTSYRSSNLSGNSTRNVHTTRGTSYTLHSLTLIKMALIKVVLRRGDQEVAHYRRKMRTIRL